MSSGEDHRPMLGSHSARYVRRSLSVHRRRSVVLTRSSSAIREVGTNGWAGASRDGTFGPPTGTKARSEAGPSPCRGSAITARAGCRRAGGIAERQVPPAAQCLPDNGAGWGAGGIVEPEVPPAAQCLRGDHLWPAAAGLRSGRCHRRHNASAITAGFCAGSVWERSQARAAGRDLARAGLRSDPPRLVVRRASECRLAVPEWLAWPDGCP
jgi:hypothetical protein